MERTTQGTVKQTIFLEIHKKIYTLAGEAPICNGDLFQEFGYTATTPALQVVLDSTYVAPSNSDATTLELFTEIAHIHRLIPASSVSIINTPKPLLNLVSTLATILLVASLILYHIIMPHG
jgi:hypothetical protein